MSILSIGVLLCAATCAVASNILIIVPVPGKSHTMLFEPLAVELANRGHQVTYMCSFGMKEPKKNVEQILIPLPVRDGGEQFDFFEMRHMGPYKTAIIMPVIGFQMSNYTLNTDEFKKLVNGNRKYDAIIVEAFLTESVAAGLSYKLKAPLIGYGTFMPSHWVNHWVGNTAPTSYIPEPFSNLPHNMSLWQRIYNLIFSTIAESWFYYWHMASHDTLMRQHFGQDLPPMAEIIKNTSLLIVNDHFSLSFPRPTPPNMITIGGLHVRPPKPLPQDIQKYLDDSKQGAIVFSLGSNLKSSLMRPEKIQTFLDAFAKVKENVVWKFEEDLPNKPKNVFTSKWLPQADVLGHNIQRDLTENQYTFVGIDGDSAIRRLGVLQTLLKTVKFNRRAHPNIKLFITHGGLLGTTEAMDRGVPLVGIPIFGDQPMNMQQSINAGVAVSLDFDSFTSDDLVKAIREVIDNGKYKKAATERSKQLKDRIVPPMDEATYWIEYVIRHKGAPHLRSSVQNLTWYQAQQFDAFAIILLIAYIVFKVIKICIKALWTKLCGSKKATKVKTN